MQRVKPHQVFDRHPTETGAHDVLPTGGPSTTFLVEPSERPFQTDARLSRRGRSASRVKRLVGLKPLRKYALLQDPVEEREREEAKTSASAKIANELVHHRFALTERVCRKLNRATLDPRVIGDHLHYLDNQVSSDVLVFFLPGLGLDEREFDPILRRLPYRGLSPTPYGCEPDRRERVSLPLADHITILREWLRDATQRFQPAIVVMVGFALGADMRFQLLHAPSDETPPKIDAFLSLECNLSLETCFGSRVLANIKPERPETWIVDLKRCGDTVDSLDEWLTIHEYLVKVMRKFQADVGVLQRAAADLVRPFSEEPGFDVFARSFKAARERVPSLRLVFCDLASSRAALAHLKLENLDRGILAGEFSEGQIVVWPKTDHFGLMAPEQILRQVDELVADVRERRNLSFKPR